MVLTKLFTAEVMLLTTVAAPTDWAAFLSRSDPINRFIVDQPLTLPDEWLENPDVFFRLDYDTKKSMLVELMKKNMKGLSFADIRLQETVRYLDNLVNISESARGNRIEEMKKDS